MYSLKILCTLTLLLLVPHPYLIGDDLSHIYQKYGDKYSTIDPPLLKAIATVESDEDPEAINPDDPSYGLMQILVSPANCSDGPYRELPGLNMRVSKEELMDPETNVRVAAKILDWNIRHYGYPRGLAIYNAWSARKSPVDGPFPNQEYVDKVTHKITKERINNNDNSRIRIRQ